MTVRASRPRVQSRSVEVNGKLFFNNSMVPNNEGMRAAAKRFVKTPEFHPEALYYDGFFVDGRWEFRKPDCQRNKFPERG